MKKTQNNHRHNSQEKPSRKVRLEVYDDGLYVGTIQTDYHWDDKHPIAEEVLLEYVYKKMPTRKKKYLSVKIV